MSKGILKIFKNSADLSLCKQTSGFGGRPMLRHNAAFVQDVTDSDFCTSTMDSHFTTMMWICVEMMNNSDHLLWIYTPENNSMEPEKWWDWKTFSFPFEGWPIQGAFAISFRECILFVGRCHSLPTWCTALVFYRSKGTFSSGVVCVLAFSCVMR